MSNLVIDGNLYLSGQTNSVDSVLVVDGTNKISYVSGITITETSNISTTTLTFIGGILVGVNGSGTYEYLITSIGIDNNNELGSVSSECWDDVVIQNNSFEFENGILKSITT